MSITLTSVLFAKKLVTIRTNNWEKTIRTIVRPRIDFKLHQQGFALLETEYLPRIYIFLLFLVRVVSLGDVSGCATNSLGVQHLMQTSAALVVLERFQVHTPKRHSQ